jgi:PAS domain-containing protein
MTTQPASFGALLPAVKWAKGELTTQNHHKESEKTRCLKIAERKLQQSEEQLISKTALLEAQVHSSLDGILIVDPDGIKVLENQRTIDLWNMPREMVDEVDQKFQTLYRKSDVPLCSSGGNQP